MGNLTPDTEKAMKRVKQEEETEIVLELLVQYRDEIRAVINPILGLDDLKARMVRIEDKLDALMVAVEAKEASQEAPIEVKK